MHAELRERCPWVEELIVVGDSAPVGALTWDELIEQGRFSSYDRAAVELARPSHRMTCAKSCSPRAQRANPKGVMHTQNTLNAASDLWFGALWATASTSTRGCPVARCSIWRRPWPIRPATCTACAYRSTPADTSCLQDVWDPTRVRRPHRTTPHRGLHGRHPLPGRRPGDRRRVRA